MIGIDDDLSRALVELQLTLDLVDAAGTGAPGDGEPWLVLVRRVVDGVVAGMDVCLGWSVNI